MGRARLFVLIALASPALLALLFWAARTTALGVRVDTGAMVGVTEARSPRVHRATTDVLETIDVSSLALIGGSLIALALLRGHAAAGFGIAVILVGANVTTQLLKLVLAESAIVPPDEASAITSSFPSGHATVAMSLALAGVLAAPSAARMLAALAGAGYAAAVGVALVALDWHYPSDVAGGYLVSAGWTALVAAGLTGSARRVTRRGRGTRAAATGAAAALVVGALAFAAVVAVTVSRHPDLVVLGRAHTAFFLSCGALAGFSLLLAAATAALIETSSRVRPA